MKDPRFEPDRTHPVQLGYGLSSEEHPPRRLVELAVRAERAGFSFAGISDHFHPWTSRQGQSSFVWAVIGAIANATDQLSLMTGVTCPIMRVHPAILAQATATTAVLMPRRFTFGVGTGEHLNEHITGEHWPPIDVRLEMLEEAITVIRELWKGKNTSHRGRHFTVEDARIFSVPDVAPPVVVAATGMKAAEFAGRIGDGLVSTAPKAEVVDAFRAAGGRDKPVYGQVTVCYAADEAQARATAHEWWPTAGIPGELGQELRLSAYFEQAAQHVTPEEVAARIVCGPDRDRHVEAIAEFVRAGFDHVYVHQVGPRQDEFFAFYEREIIPSLRTDLVGAQR
jgi:G6PDH family F420-dependent oxidoreductase